MKKIILLTLTALLTLGMLLIAPSAASAHTPSITATCDGIVLSATSYDGDKDNKWYVKVGDAVSEGKFGESYSRTFPVAQQGKSTSWSATIQAHDGSFKESKSGTVGPCGTAPPVDTYPDKEVSVCWKVDNPANGIWPQTLSTCPIPDKAIGCEDEQYQFDKYWIRDQSDEDYLAGLKHLRGEEDDLRLDPHDYYVTPILKGDPTKCEPVTPPKPDPVVKVKDKKKVDCVTKVTTIITTTTTTGWKYDKDANAWVKEIPVVVSTETSRPSTNGELWSNDCADIPKEPEPEIEVTSESLVDCVDEVTEVTTTTTTTTFDYNIRKNTWEPGLSVEEVVVITRPSTPQELLEDCDQPIVTPEPPTVATPEPPTIKTPEQPPVTDTPKSDSPEPKIGTPISEEAPPVTTSVGKEMLPHTGAPSMKILGLSAMLLLMGGVVLGAARFIRLKS